MALVSQLHIILFFGPLAHSDRLFQVIGPLGSRCNSSFTARLIARRILHRNERYTVVTLASVWM